MSNKSYTTKELTEIVHKLSENQSEIIGFNGKSSEDTISSIHRLVELTGKIQDSHNDLYGIVLKIVNIIGIIFFLLLLIILYLFLPNINNLLNGLFIGWESVNQYWKNILYITIAGIIGTIIGGIILIIITPKIKKIFNIK